MTVWQGEFPRRCIREHMADKIVGQGIFTTQPGSEQYGLNELLGTGCGVRLLEWMEPGTTRIEIEEGFSALARALRDRLPIFVRHICPAERLVELTGQLSDLEAVAQAARELAGGGRLDPGRRFSVQTRLIEKVERGYHRSEMDRAVAEVLLEQGGSWEVRHPDQVVSVVCTRDRAFVGLSDAADNLSDWPGGEHRFAREEDQISRAQFKLLEAIDVFHLPLTGQGGDLSQGGRPGTALDLGAAPGGWTKVLRGLGMEVTAVDPANLHPSMEADPGVIHKKMTAQEYFQAAGRFDLVVNDMKMDTGESTQIMGMAAGCLRPGGLAVMTLKLPKRGMQKIVNQTLKRLECWYDLIGARQLFHNRAEITVALRRRQD